MHLKFSEDNEESETLLNLDNEDFMDKSKVHDNSKAKSLGSKQISYENPDLPQKKDSKLPVKKKLNNNRVVHFTNTINKTKEDPTKKPNNDSNTLNIGKVGGFPSFLNSMNTMNQISNPKQGNCLVNNQGNKVDNNNTTEKLEQEQQNQYENSTDIEKNNFKIPLNFANSITLNKDTTPDEKPSKKHNNKEKPRTKDNNNKLKIINNPANSLKICFELPISKEKETNDCFSPNNTSHPVINNHNNGYQNHHNKNFLMDERDLINELTNNKPIEHKEIMNNKIKSSIIESDFKKVNPSDKFFNNNNNNANTNTYSLCNSNNNNPQMYKSFIGGMKSTAFNEDFSMLDDKSTTVNTLFTQNNNNTTTITNKGLYPEYSNNNDFSFQKSSFSPDELVPDNRDFDSILNNLTYGQLLQMDELKDVPDIDVLQFLNSKRTHCFDSLSTSSNKDSFFLCGSGDNRTARLNDIQLLNKDQYNLIESTQNENNNFLNLHENTKE